VWRPDQLGSAGRQLVRVLHEHRQSEACEP
jgi:hypothetical protein